MRIRERGVVVTESCSMRRTQPPESMSRVDHWRSLRSTSPRSMSSLWTSKAGRPSGGREAAPPRRPHRAIDRHADGRRSSAPRHDVQSSWQALGLSIVTGGGDDAAQTGAMDRVGGCRPLAPTHPMRVCAAAPIAVLACPERSQSVTRPPGSRDERRAGSKGARSISLAAPSRINSATHTRSQSTHPRIEPSRCLKAAAIAPRTSRAPTASRRQSIPYIL
jgi:hypothetical protein